jgi:hypothetical protein
MNRRNIVRYSVLICALALVCARQSNIRAQNSAELKANPVGMFENHTDVGKVLHPGSVEYDAAKQTYTISGSGENMWFRDDSLDVGAIGLNALSSSECQHKKQVSVSSSK